MSEDFSIHVNDAIARIGREAWDACAAPTGDPFVSYDFLHACEASGSAAARQGWAARHLALTADDGRILGVMPLYLKANSQGEYVFDHSWADAYERAGGRYYPKLLGAVPFTPATGPRFLSHPDADAETVRNALIQGALGLAGQSGVSSLHVNFPTEADWTAMTEAGLMPRIDMQFIWRNDGYQSFDDFLAALSSNRRKTIRRERREAQAGLDIRPLTGAEITEAHWDAFFAFYMDTGSRKWGRPYLTRDFFSRVGQTMADRIVLVMAFRDGEAIAGALNFIGRDALYGRQWGAGRGPLPPFRALLLSGHRLRHRPRAQPRRGGRAGRAQDRAGLPALPRLFGPLDRRPGARETGRRLSGPRARSGGLPDRGHDGGAVALPTNHSRSSPHRRGPRGRVRRLG